MLFVYTVDETTIRHCFDGRSTEVNMVKMTNTLAAADTLPQLR